MSHRKLAPALAVGALLAVPAGAHAHITLQPSTATAGSYTVEAVRVPNERNDAATTRIRLQLPGGFAAVSYKKVAGWKVKITTGKLATPVETDDGPITEQVKEISWTATSRAAGIQPGQYEDFPVSVLIPGKAGQTLTFKALQTYSDGEIVRWIGAPDADTPAPQVKLTAASARGAQAGTGATGASGGSSPAASPTAAPAAAIDDGGSDGLAIVALIIAAVAAGVGGAALLGRGRRPTGADRLAAQ